jgi:ribose transport system substrate-binding protein
MHTLPPRLRLLVLVSIIASCLMLAACGEDDAQTAAGGDTRAAQGGGTVGFSVPQGADPALKLMERGIRAEAEKASIEVKTTDAALDVNKQLSDLDAFIQQRVDAIVVWPLDSQAVQPALERAKAANIPVVAVYTLAGGPYFTNLLIEGDSVGRSGARYLADQLGRGAKVAAVFGPPQVDQFREVAEGFQAGAKDQGLELVETQVDGKISSETAATIVQGFKQRHGSDLDGVFVSSETQSHGASATIGGDFRPQVATYGATDDVMKSLRDGQLSGVVHQNIVLIGRIAGWASAKAAAGEEIPTELRLDPPVIDRERAQAFPDTEQQLVKDYAFEPEQRQGRWYMPLFK